MVSKEKFVDITKQVINTLEGGYFHPYMFDDGRLKYNDMYKNSGETMFGLDRHAGHGLFYSSQRISSDVRSNLANIESGKYQYKTKEAQEFWSALDKANARKSWRWNYKGGGLQEPLTNLAAEMMYEPFVRYSNMYLNEKAKKIVESDPRLIFHFAYAVWNGQGRFKTYAENMNSWVDSGITDTNELVNRAISSRANSSNSIIAKQGRKMQGFIDDIKFSGGSVEQKKSNYLIPISLLAVGAFLVIFAVLSSKNKSR
jgi:hypothetical protein